jgi:uncharacterized protein
MSSGARRARSRHDAAPEAMLQVPVGAGRAPGRQAAFAVACIAAGFLPVAVGYVPDGAARLAGSVAVPAAFLVLALMTRRSAAMRGYWEIPLAFFGLAIFVLADRYVPRFLTAQVLHSPPVTGNPLASSVRGTVVVALDELVLTVLAVLAVLLISRRSLASISVRRGRFGRAYVIGIVGMVGFYVLTFRALSRSRFLPVHGTFDLGRYLGLTPALLVAVAANGFLEELMFRGLLMSRLNLAFGPYLATFIQAAIFASWHIGVTYAASALVLAVLFAFPLGLIGGYLTRSSGSIIPSSLFHAGADIPIYLAFLSYTS